MTLINWPDVRYRGDADDVKELFDEYRVGDYVEAFEEHRRQQEQGVRSELLREGIRLSERLSPRIFEIFGSVCGTLGLESEAEVFCLPSPIVNAMAILDIDGDGTSSLIGVTSAALENLEDDELASVLGHELGHFLFDNHRMNALLSTNEDNPCLTVLPPLGESLFLRWRKKSEISADRVGLLACGDFHAAGRGLMKATFGLSQRNINLDIDALLDQIDEIKGRPELMTAEFASHPLLPIRLKALALFARSAKAQRAGITLDGRPIEDATLEDEIADLMRLTQRGATGPREKAVMRAVAAGGIEVLSADGEVSDDEIKILIEMLHHYFTDEPEKEILFDRRELKTRLEEAIGEVNRVGHHDDKTFILSRLADVALADGALMDTEGAVILDIAGRLQIPAKNAYGIMIGAANAVGFRVDVKLNRIAEELRRSLRIGFGLARAAGGGDVVTLGES